MNVKKFMAFCLALALCVPVAGAIPSLVDGSTVQVSAETTEDGFEYKVTEDGTATITGYTGSDTEIIIPSEIDGYTVTEIGKYAFHTPAPGVSENFNYADGTSITFNYNETYYNLKSVTIPNTVQNIGSHAFDGCASIEEITIPEGVTSIGNGVFLGLYQLRDCIHRVCRG